MFPQHFNLPFLPPIFRQQYPLYNTGYADLQPIKSSPSIQAVSDGGCLQLTADQLNFMPLEESQQPSNRTLMTLAAQNETKCRAVTAANAYVNASNYAYSDTLGKRPHQVFQKGPEGKC